MILRTNFLILLLAGVFQSLAQTDSATFLFKKHELQSVYLDESREYWVSFPYGYSDTSTYSVMYVLDAEWRFDLIRNVEFDYSANRKIQKHIIVGIPHVEWEVKRSRELTFSQSRMEYDGDPVDSTWYNARNAGGAMSFYQFLKQELIPAINSNYSTNGRNTLVGHSLGGYFAGYLLSMDHPFESLHIYDPAIWWGDGEVTSKIREGIPKKDKVRVLITYQPVPGFHRTKIEELINELSDKPNIHLNHQLYEHETHNSLFLPSFILGMELIKMTKAPGR